MFALSSSDQIDLAYRMADRLVHASPSLRELVSAREIRQILSYQPALECEYTYLCDRQVQSLFQKNEALDLGVDTEAVAFGKWKEAQAACRNTNALFRNRLGFNWTPFASVSFERARRIIRRVLGTAPRFDQLDLSFGPGSTTSVKKKNASPTTKMASGLYCSERLLCSGLLPSLLREIPHWTAALSPNYFIDDEGWLCELNEVRIVPGRMTFVAKNWKTKRTICSEPTLNSLAQQGVRKWMECRMARFGLQISDQTVNQRLARQGSIDGSISTIDLSSASDTISIELVRYLFPSDWFFLLDSIRTGTVEYKGETIDLEMYASMGNATTFPVETLIFYALARAVSSPDDTVTAYGDDLCVGTSCSNDVIAILECAGFLVNREKSFTHGPFRESCGKDYLRGVMVRPVYMKKGDILSLYALRNQLLDDFPEIASVVLDAIPRWARFYGPRRLSHAVLWSDSYIATRCSKTQSYAIECLTSEPITRKNFYPGDWVSPLYSVYTRASALGSCVGKDGIPTYVTPGGTVVRTKLYIS